MPGTIIKALTTDMGIDGVKPQIRKFINNNRKEWPPIYKAYMNVDENKELFVEDLEMGGFSGLPKKDEGDYLNYLAPGIGNKTRYQPDEFQGAFAITSRDRRFNRVNKVEKYIRALERAARATMERIAVMPFSLGFSSSFPINDNLPLFSTSHVNPAGVTVANRPSSDVDLTVASLEAALIAFSLQVGPDGNPIVVQPKYLLVHPSNGPNARRITGSDYYFTGGVPGAASTGVPNIIKDQNLVVVTNPYLPTPHAWFLLPEKDQHEIQVVSNQPLEDYSFEDPQTRDYVYSLSFMMTSGASSFVATYGTLGS